MMAVRSLARQLSDDCISGLLKCWDGPIGVAAWVVIGLAIGVFMGVACPRALGKGRRLGRGGAVKEVLEYATRPREGVGCRFLRSEGFSLITLGLGTSGAALGPTFSY